MNRTLSLLFRRGLTKDRVEIPVHNRESNLNQPNLALSISDAKYSYLVAECQAALSAVCLAVCLSAMRHQITAEVMLWA